MEHRSRSMLQVGAESSHTRPSLHSVAVFSVWTTLIAQAALIIPSDLLDISGTAQLMKHTGVTIFDSACSVLPVPTPMYSTHVDPLCSVQPVPSPMYSTHVDPLCSVQPVPTPMYSTHVDPLCSVHPAPTYTPMYSTHVDPLCLVGPPSAGSAKQHPRPFRTCCA